MKYIENFRNERFAKALLEKITTIANPTQHYQLMEFCGGHTHTIHRFGIPSLLPKNVEMIHGPGCPVCVLPIARIDKAIAIAQLPGVIFCSYADMLRVPGSKRKNLLHAKSQGADVRMVYSVDDVLAIAKQYPHKQIVFFAIGFETTTPPTAVALQQAKREQICNFSVFCNHVLTPVAMEALLKIQQTESKSSIHLDGFVGPAHVSIVVGSDAYKKISQVYKKPVVISGFEPLDVLQSIAMLIQQINEKRCEVENQYARAVTSTGNLKAQQIIADTLELRPTFEWRGLGFIPHSALQIKPSYAEFDAEKRFDLPDTIGCETKGCECAAVLCGIKKPQECKLFATVCTPENPLGSCMVSSEGACAAVYAYSQ